MNLNVEVLNPLVALIAGILILIMPRLLNYVVAIYLIVIGILGLSHHFHSIFSRALKSTAELQRALLFIGNGVWPE
jgi:Protein of unknown function (DUF3096)